MIMEKKVAIMAVLADGEGGEPMPTIGIISVVVFTYSIFVPWHIGINPNDYLVMDHEMF
jgi:hypothetical protein